MYVIETWSKKYLNWISGRNQIVDYDDHAYKVLLLFKKHESYMKTSNSYAHMKWYASDVLSEKTPKKYRQIIVVKINKQETTNKKCSFSQ